MESSQLTVYADQTAGTYLPCVSGAWWHGVPLWLDSCVFLFLFSASRLLQWIVAPTTSGRGEGCRLLKATRSGCVHSVNNGRHDLRPAPTSDRCRLWQARRVTRFHASNRGGCERSLRQVFTSRTAFTLPAPHSDERTPDEVGTRGVRGHAAAPLRCNFLPQARAIIASRPAGLFTCVRMAAVPLYRAAQRLL